MSDRTVPPKKYILAAFCYRLPSEKAPDAGKPFPSPGKAAILCA